MWWPFRTPHLPLAEGPYVPGCFDLMTEYSPEGCFLRVYYPTSLKDVKAHSSKWVTWLPNSSYLKAFAIVLNMWVFLIKAIFKILMADKAKVPVVWEAELRKEGGKLPVIVFSHGLGASRFFYSSICIELASRGFVVGAVEHRDRSACSTFYYANPDARRTNNATKVTFEKIPLGWNHLPARQKQVQHRAGECQRALNLLEMLNDGKSVDNIMGDQFRLSQFKGRLDFSRLVMMGHSFGGATCIRTLGNDSRFKVGVVLDGWMFPVKEDMDLPTIIKQPLLFINTQTFQIAQNVSVMRRFMEGEVAENTERRAFTMRHTTHEHQADSPFLVGVWLNLFMKKLDSLIALRINNHLLLNFLHKHVGVPSGAIDEEFLLNQDINIAHALSVA